VLLLKDNEIHLWMVELERYINFDAQQICTAMLSADEHARAQKFCFNHHRERFITTRGVIRSILSRYCENINPEDWRFQFGAQGKPSIESPTPTKLLHFNISHSKNRIVVAVSLHSSIGVDVESVSAKREFVKIAQRYFSAPEVEELLCLTPAHQLSRFYDLWTLKESYIKACGSGLIIPLRQFAFRFPLEETIMIRFDNNLNEKPDDWNFWQFEDGENYRLALALKHAAYQSDYRIITRELLSLNEDTNSEIFLKRSTQQINRASKA